MEKCEPDDRRFAVIPGVMKIKAIKNIRESNYIYYRYEILVNQTKAEPR